MSGIFPPELIDYVIDHLWNDKKALRACSLVCCTWAPASRYHLFHEFSVCIRRMADFQALPEYIPLVGPSVHQFSLTILLEWTDESTRLEPYDNLLHLLAASMPNVQNIRVWFTRITTLFSGQKISPSTAQFERVKELQLFHCGVKTAGDFRRLMHAFPRLEVLTLKHIRWCQVGAADTISLECALNATSKSGLCQVVHASHASPNSSQEFLRVENVLQALGQDLERVSLTFNCAISFLKKPEEHCRALAYCTNLRSLHVDFGDSIDLRFSQCIAAFVQILISASSQSLQEVSFRIGCGFPTLEDLQAAEEAWTSFGGVPMQGRFSQLGRVSMLAKLFGNSVPREVLQSCMVDGMRKLNSHSAIKIDLKIV